MTLQFQPPNIPQAPSKTEALLTPVNNAIQTLPMLWLQYQNQKKQHELQAMELDLKKRQMESQYGTGAPPPMSEGSSTPTTTPDNLTPDEQMLMGTNYTPPQDIQETPEQKLARLGTEAYKTLNPTQYVAPGVDPATGQPTFTLYPAGTKPGPASPGPTPILNPAGQQVGTTIGKPTVLPKPTEPKGPPAPVQNRFDTDFSKAYNFLSKVKGNLDTLQSDISAGDQGQPRKLTLGKFNPTAGQGVIGSFTRAVGLGTPEQAAFASNVGKVNDIYRKEITGTQAGFTELQKLESRLPTTAEGEPQFIAKSQDTLNQGIQALEKELERAKAKGVDTSIYEQQLGELKGSLQNKNQGAGLPSVGDLFQGHKVLSVKRVK